MESGGEFFLLQTILWLVLSGRCYSSQPDVLCLKTLQQSLIDPDNNLKYTWKFENATAGFICNFNGVECWHPDENRVLNLDLSNMNLQGQFPVGLENCQRLTGLDLSNNKFSGPIPDDISKRIPLVTSLNLSFNSFSGDMPSSFFNCAYLNVLDLQHNQLTGTIPWQISTLSRLRSLNVADNLLSGPIPSFPNNSFPAKNFANNQGLCGKPLDVCVGSLKNSSTTAVIRSAIEGVVVTILVAGVVMCCVIFVLKRIGKRKKIASGQRV